MEALSNRRVCRIIDESFWGIGSVRALLVEVMASIGHIISKLLANRGPSGNQTEHALIVPSQDAVRIQEAHILRGRILCELIEQELSLA